MPVQERAGSTLKPPLQKVEGAYVENLFRRSQRRVALACLPLFALVACHASQDAVDVAWPAGGIVSADTASLRRLLTALSKHGDTPLATSSRTLLANLPACPHVEAVAADGGFDGLTKPLHCSTLETSLADFRQWRGDHSLAVAWPIGDGPRLLIRATESKHPGATDSTSDWTFDLHWPVSKAPGVLGTLLPGRRNAGPPVFASDDDLMHVRVRSDEALDLADWAASGGQGDQLFRLRSDLFSGAILDGSWEMALYPPASGGKMPLAVAALGVTLESVAAGAFDRFLSEIESTWNLSRTPQRFGNASGACLYELRILPEFAPCAVTTRGAVLVGWNHASLAHALAAEPSAFAEDTGGQLEIDFERIEQTDATLALLGQHTRAEPVDWPWRHLRAHGSRDADGVKVTMQLRGDAG